MQATDGTDMDVVIAALLHDVVEDTPTSYEDVAANFGGSRSWRSSLGCELALVELLCTRIEQVDPLSA